MRENNQQLRELFTLPPIQSSGSTALAIPEMPPQQKITGDIEVDAVLWLQSVVETGNQGLIDKALEAAKRIKTPMKELEKRYTAHVGRANPGNVFAVLFATMDFGDLESQAKKAIEQAGRRHEAISRFDDVETLFSNTPAEISCKKALRGLKRSDFGFYDGQQAGTRFEKSPALVPATIDDSLHARAYWSKLYWLRAASNDGMGDPAPQGYAHETYCRDMLAVIPPRNAAEAIAAFEHINDDNGTDWETVQPIIRNLIASGWAAAEQGAGTDTDPAVVPQRIRNAIENLAGGRYPELVQQLFGLLRPYFASPWAWTGDAMPPMGATVICLDDPVNRPHDLCVATRDADWDDVLCWWMHIPPTPDSRGSEQRGRP